MHAPQQHTASRYRARRELNIWFLRQSVLGEHKPMICPGQLDIDFFKTDYAGDRARFFQDILTNLNEQTHRIDDFEISTPQGTTVRGYLRGAASITDFDSVKRLVIIIDD